MPEVQQVHIDAALTGVSVMYRNADFIADLVAPPVAVRRQSDRYFVYDPKREALRPTLDRRSPGAEASEVDFDLSSDSYFCEDHALAAAVPDEERDNADPAIQPDIDRVEFLTGKIALNREQGLEEMLRTHPDVPEATLDPADRWQNAGTDPVARIETARAAVFAACGRRANTLVIGYEVFNTLRHHPAVIDRVKYSMGAVVTEDLLARLMDLDRVVVGRAVRNNAVKGRPAAVGPVWGRDAYLMHQPPRAGLKQVMAAVTFAWTGAGGVQGTVVERWREPARRADMVRVQKYYDHKMVAPSAAHRLLQVIG